MTLNDLQADVYRRCNFDSSPASDVTTRITAFLNKWHRRILSDARFVTLRNDTYALTSVSGTGVYGLPPVIGRINRMTQPSNTIVLQERSEDWLRQHDPGLTFTNGPSELYIRLGQRQVATQPSDASELFVKSDSATDGASKTAYLEGYLSGGYLRTASVVLNGITAATFGASITTWIEVTKFYLALTSGGTATMAAGNITLREDSGAGTELARIGIGQSYARYEALRLWPTPTGEVYTLDFTRRILDLVNLTDEPILPEDFHWLLASGAVYEEFLKQDDTRRQDVWTEVREGLNDLNAYVNNPPGYRPTTLPHRYKPSTLGPWFPAGT